MITRQTAFVIGNKVFATLEEAQIAELDAIFAADPTTPASVTIMKNVDKVLDVLTTKATSKPRARKINGGRKPRNVTKLTQTEMAAQ